MGITPAGAGKTEVISIICPLIQDHPRRCGENDFFEIIGYVRIGSPPQVRGKQVSFSCFTYRFRITPAGAGKTLEVNRYDEAIEDHPRRCGENERV